jgi:hypothetical protein
MIGATHFTGLLRVADLPKSTIEATKTPPKSGGVLSLVAARPTERVPVLAQNRKRNPAVGAKLLVNR